MSIPKIIHQLWIGPKEAPINLMNTWREKNLDFEYIFWNEKEISERNMIFKCQEKIDEIEEINGKADIMRWEILYKYGGVFIDADSICIEPIDEEILNKKCFAGWEQEEARQGLIATGTMGFPPKHPLVKDAIKFIFNNEVSQIKSQMMAWMSVGPGLLTRLYNTGKFKDLFVFPSYTFLPIHYTGIEYTGHSKIYAYQEWGSTKQNYDIMNNMILPQQFNTPPKEKSVSVLVSSFNTPAKFIKDCLQSIKIQKGYYNIELVWINDGSDKLNTELLKNLLKHFIKTSRFITLIYHENDTNRGIGYSLNKGIKMCNNDIIIKMDSDDIMFENRIEKQLEFMELHPDIMICGSQLLGFKDNIHNVEFTTNHPIVTWEKYKQNPCMWFVNHPTLCYRKSAILAIGNYDMSKSQMTEDFDMEIRMLKKYGTVYNLPEPLLYYRLHDKQVTYKGGNGGANYWNNIRMKLINDIVNS
jgi:mannosyltransferase OCH1-like enzyme